MKLPFSAKLAVSVLTSVAILDAPFTAYAAGGMITTSAAVAELSRSQAQDKLDEFLSREDVSNELLARGVEPKEVSMRLASLSDHELRQLAGQAERGQYGGEVITLGTVLLVVLILVLIGKL